MRDVYDIVFRLTLSCVLAAVVMGGVFVLTNNAKKHNEHVNEQKVILGLLGYDEQNPAPTSMELFNIYRYIISEGEQKFLGYVLPLHEGASFQLVMIDLEGKFAARHDLQIDGSKLLEEDARGRAIASALSEGADYRYADEAIIVSESGERSAYLLPGQFAGFKAFIKVFLALNREFTILGFEVVELEEDPGLGGEIEKAYFKNQFDDRPIEVMREIQVLRVPLPDDYREYLEREVGELEIAEEEKLRNKYRESDIHALTGATISSKAVTNGLKNMLKKFAYRLVILDRVIAEQSIPVAF